MTDNTKATVNINGEFTADELEDIIRRLGETRAGTLPAVPKNPPSMLSLDSVLSEQEDTLFTVKTLDGGGLRIYLRSDGFGWQVFNVSPSGVLGIRDLLSKQIGHTYSPQSRH